MAAPARCRQGLAAAKRLSFGQRAAFRHSMLDGAKVGRRAAAWVVAHDFC